MAGMVEQSIHQAIASISGRDSELARTVIRGDRGIDLMQNEVERRAMNLLATQQPVAGDLRFLSSTIKILSFLERMGDQAVNVAQRSLALCELETMEVPPNLLAQADIAREMTASCLDAYLREDVAICQAVMQRDDDLDALNRVFLEEMIQWMNDERRLIRRGVEYILASRHLERVGDEATNIAEEVIFLVEGRMVRHGGEEDFAVGPL